MATNFSSLRSQRSAALSKLAQEAKRESNKAGDARFWKLSVDAKTKVGYAVIRFLPAVAGEDVPWVRVFNHGFKLNGQWFIDNCPTTLGERSCPVCKENNRLWNTGVETDKNIARDRKRKLGFISNILVVNDPAHPENNGKVFLFKYGKKIHEKITDLIEPKFPDQPAANPFDLWEGSNFKLKSQDASGFQNYDKSAFDSPSELFPGDDAAKETLWQSEHALQPFIADTEFKSFDELNKRFTTLITGVHNAPATVEDAVNARPTVADLPALDDGESGPVKPKAVRAPKAAPAPKLPTPPSDDDEEEIRRLFGDVTDDNE